MTLTQEITHVLLLWYGYGSSFCHVRHQITVTQGSLRSVNTALWFVGVNENQSSLKWNIFILYPLSMKQINSVISVIKYFDISIIGNSLKLKWSSEMYYTETVGHTAFPVTSVNQVWKLGVVGSGLKIEGVLSPKSSTDEGQVAQDWGYHPQNFNLIIHKSFQFWKWPLWKVFSSHIQVHFRI